MTAAVLQFLACGLVLVLAATLLARAADAIAELTKIGKVWIGAVLVAAATSLPELATDVAAVRQGAIDLAAGDLFGSSMANMLILALVDLLPAHRGGGLISRASLDNALTAALAIIMGGLAAVCVLTRPTHSLWGLAPESLMFVVIYLAGTRAIYHHGRRSGALVVDAAAATGTPAKSMGRAIATFALAAAVILIAAPFFASAAVRIAELSGLGSTFVGTLLVGLSTSLPELVATVAAARMGAFDLAAGNLFGSNAFNMVIFFAMDLAAPTPVFTSLDPSHAVSALMGLVLTAIGLAAIVYRAEQRFSLLVPSSALILATYVAGVALLYLQTRA